MPSTDADDAVVDLGGEETANDPLVTLVGGRSRFHSHTTQSIRRRTGDRDDARRCRRRRRRW